MPTPSTRLTGAWQKRIPTLAGLLVLVAGLVVGMVVFAQGTGVFAPRAAPETTPKNVKITNVSDRSFSISFFTDTATVGYANYGTAANALKLRVSDDRDQISGAVGSFLLHHVTVSGLEADTQYYFVIGTEGRAQYDDGGKPFAVKTAKRGGAAPPAKTIHGSVTTEAGAPAVGSVVYVKLEGAGEQSSLVKESGSWAIPLSAARKTDGSGYATIKPETPLNLVLQGTKIDTRAELPTTVGAFPNGKTLSLSGKFGELAAANGPTATPSLQPTLSVTITATPTPTGTSGTPTPTSAALSPTPRLSITPTVTASVSLTLTPTASPSGTLTGLGSRVDGTSGALGSLLGQTPTPVPTNTVVDLQALATGAESVVTTSEPSIKGVAAPGVTVKIVVHSDTQIDEEVTADANGNFTLDIAELSKDLEPGEHTVQYSYIDPATGQTVVKNYTFTVTGTGGNLALAGSPTPTRNLTPSPTRNPSITPSPTGIAYGTDYPYSRGSTPSASPSAIMSRTPTPATRSAMVGTGSGVPVSGAVGTTMALLLGGLLFTFAGVWSFWAALQLEQKEA